MPAYSVGIRWFFVGAQKKVSQLPSKTGPQWHCNLLSRISHGKAVKFIPMSGKLISSWQTDLDFEHDTVCHKKQVHTLKELSRLGAWQRCGIKLNAAPIAACFIRTFANLCGVDARLVRHYSERYRSLQCLKQIIKYHWNLTFVFI